MGKAASNKIISSWPFTPIAGRVGRYYFCLSLGRGVESQLKRSFSQLLIKPKRKGRQFHKWEKMEQNLNNDLLKMEFSLKNMSLKWEECFGSLNPQLLAKASAQWFFGTGINNRWIMTKEEFTGWKLTRVFCNAKQMWNDASIVLLVWSFSSVNVDRSCKFSLTKLFRLEAVQTIMSSCRLQV